MHDTLAKGGVPDYEIKTFHNTLNSINSMFSKEETKQAYSNKKKSKYNNSMSAKSIHKKADKPKGSLHSKISDKELDFEFSKIVKSKKLDQNFSTIDRSLFMSKKHLADQSKHNKNLNINIYEQDQFQMHNKPNSNSSMNIFAGHDKKSSSCSKVRASLFQTEDTTHRSCVGSDRRLAGIGSEEETQISAQVDESVLSNSQKSKKTFHPFQFFKTKSLKKNDEKLDDLNTSLTRVIEIDENKEAMILGGTQNLQPSTMENAKNHLTKKSKKQSVHFENLENLDAIKRKTTENLERSINLLEEDCRSIFSNVKHKKILGCASERSMLIPRKKSSTNISVYNRFMSAEIDDFALSSHDKTEASNPSLKRTSVVKITTPVSGSRVSIKELFGMRKNSRVHKEEVNNNLSTRFFSFLTVNSTNSYRKDGIMITDPHIIKDNRGSITEIDGDEAFKFWKILQEARKTDEKKQRKMKILQSKFKNGFESLKESSPKHVKFHSKSKDKSRKDLELSMLNTPTNTKEEDLKNKSSTLQAFLSRFTNSLKNSTANKFTYNNKSYRIPAITGKTFRNQASRCKGKKNIAIGNSINELNNYIMRDFTYNGEMSYKSKKNTILAQDFFKGKSEKTRRQQYLDNIKTLKETLDSDDCDFEENDLDDSYVRGLNLNGNLNSNTNINTNTVTFKKEIIPAAEKRHASRVFNLKNKKSFIIKEEPNVNQEYENFALVSRAKERAKTTSQMIQNISFEYEHPLENEENNAMVMTTDIKMSNIKRVQRLRKIVNENYDYGSDILGLDNPKNFKQKLESIKEETKKAHSNREIDLPKYVKQRFTSTTNNKFKSYTGQYFGCKV